MELWAPTYNCFLGSLCKGPAHRNPQKKSSASFAASKRNSSSGANFSNFTDRIRAIQEAPMFEKEMRYPTAPNTLWEGV